MIKMPTIENAATNLVIIMYHIMLPGLMWGLNLALVFGGFELHVHHLGI